MTHEEISKQCQYTEEHYKRCWVEGYIAALKALDRPLDVVPELRPTVWSEGYRHGYDDAEKDILAIIESRISEILGDAQPKPVLRAELEELIKRIKEEK